MRHAGRPDLERPPAFIACKKMQHLFTSDFFFTMLHSAHRMCAEHHPLNNYIGPVITIMDSSTSQNSQGQQAQPQVSPSGLLQALQRQRDQALNQCAVAEAQNADLGAALQQAGQQLAAQQEQLAANAQTLADLQQQIDAFKAANAPQMAAALPASCEPAATANA